MNFNTKKLTTLKFLTFSVLLVCSSVKIVQAQSLNEKRQTAEKAGKEFISSGFKISTNLTKLEGPNTKSELSEILGKLKGCPAAPVSEPPENISISVKPGKLGAWAGDFDGINVSNLTNNKYNMSGSGLIIPKGSTGTLDAKKEQSFEFQIGDPFQIPRAMVDTAAEQFDRCFSEYADSDLTFEEILSRCPIKNVTKQQQGQTCVLTVNGRIYDKLDEDNKYLVKMYEATMCDFIGYGNNNGNTNTGFTTCWIAFYEGTAEAGYDESNSSMISKAARNTIVKNCKNRNPKRMSRCIKNRISKALKSMS